MSPVQTPARSDVSVTEPFRRYAADWSATTARTDTPDLMGMFAERQREVAGVRSVPSAEEHDILTHPDVSAGFAEARSSIDVWKRSL